jgi:flagellar motility protein MotE (MotC chaperone)
MERRLSSILNNMTPKAKVLFTVEEEQPRNLKELGLSTISGGTTVVAQREQKLKRCE